MGLQENQKTIILPVASTSLERFGNVAENDDVTVGKFGQRFHRRQNVFPGLLANCRKHHLA